VKISRKNTLSEQVVFVDGLPGCGKTLLSNIVSSMDRVELLTYAYEIEHYCALHFLDEISLNSAQSQVQMAVDIRLYNTMMGREVNFRPSDLSSVFQNHNISRYINRLFTPGDESVPNYIEETRPVLNLTTHQLLAHSEPIWKSLKNKCIFIEVVRHPLYMVRQQILNEKNVFGTSRSFDLYFMHDSGVEIPYYVYGWEDEYLKCNEQERVVAYIKYMTDRTKKAKEKLKKEYNAKILTIPFEKFVLNTDPWVKKIESILEVSPSSATFKVMNDQNVPRDMIAQGVDIDIYRRCGWVPPNVELTERDELNIRREEIVKEVSSDALLILDRISKEYESQYWNPDV